MDAVDPITFREYSALHAKQDEALEAYYDAFNAVNKAPGKRLERQELLARPQIVAARKAYDDTVAALVALLGEDAFCNYVDMELYSTFSDYHKSVMGFRPRYFVTRKDCRAFLQQDHATA